MSIYVDDRQIGGNVSTSPSISYAKLSDTKAANTAGGSSSAGAFRTRTLNTIDIDDDSIIISLSSNQFTLAAGTYRIKAYATYHATGTSKCRIRNITDSSDELIGSNAYQGSIGVAVMTNVEGEFTIATQKVFELQSRTSISRATDGFGLQVNLGANEVYSVVEIWKVA